MAKRSKTGEKRPKMTKLQRVLSLVVVILTFAFGNWYLIFLLFVAFVLAILTAYYESEQEKLRAAKDAEVPGK